MCHMQQVRAFLLAEMCARGIKRLIRRYLRDALSRPTGGVPVSHQSLYASIVADVLNSVSGGGRSAGEFWTYHLVPQLTGQFGHRSVQ